ncbi:TolC family protein [Apibacter muscae]|uniref:TolC family protein n=1 Tax=Apibacter muscae TaxID=2509004 RepID=A0A563D975_9FLAO|nr:TolC family protein [Apibacter muscae]TWP26642.1 TolC family protein [Apibacter muscae]TWP28216.1 TolC family protein [Apibacter muscae]
MKIQPIQYITILALAGSLTSCVTAKYETPEIIDNKLYRDMNSKDSTTIADIPWSNFFKDINLQNLIKEGLQNNLDLQIAVTRIKQSEASLRSAKLGYLPTLSAEASYSNSKLNEVKGSGFRTHSEIPQLSATASWEADIWGKIASTKRSALASYYQSDAYRLVTQTSLIANIANSYFNLLAYDEQLKIMKNTIKLLEDNVQTMQYLKEANIVTGAAVEQSKALLYSTKLNVPDLESNIKTLENSISLLLGKEPGPIVRSKIEEQVIPTELEYGVPVQLLSKRPDVMMYEYAYRASFENTNIAKASLYPSLTLTGNVGYSTYQNLNNFFDYSSMFANIVGGLTQPIFNQGKLKSQLRISQAKQEEAFLNFKKAVLNSGMEVSNALYSYEKAKSKDTGRNLQIEALQKSVDFTKELLIYSNANYTEVLTAEQNLLSAKLNQVNDRLQQLQSAINLYKALGGGVN